MLTNCFCETRLPKIAQILECVFGPSKHNDIGSGKIAGCGSGEEHHILFFCKLIEVRKVNHPRQEDHGNVHAIGPKGNLAATITAHAVFLIQSKIAQERNDPQDRNVRPFLDERRAIRK